MTNINKYSCHKALAYNESNPSPFSAKGRGNVGRPSNKTCEYCGKKNVYPNKDENVWVYRRILECFNCVMVQEYMFNEITKHKPRKSSNNQLLFPLTVFGQFDTTHS